MTDTFETGGAAALLQLANATAEEAERLARFLAQFADDRLDAAPHRFVRVASGSFMLQVGPHDIARVSGIGADLAHCLARLGLGTLRHALYLLPGERERLAADIAHMRAAPERRETQTPVQLLMNAERAISGMDISTLTRQIPAYRLETGAADRHVFDEVAVALADIGALAGGAIEGNPWLVERVSTLVEHRLLHDASEATRQREAPLALHCHSRFAQSDAFWPLVDALPARTRERLILDFSSLDAAANPARLSEIFAHLRREGIDASLSDIAWERIEQIEEVAADAQWLKGRASALAGPAIAKFGVERCVATFVATPEAAADAQTMGFAVLVGMGLGAFVESRRAALGRNSN
jgi:hypothetical protein